jgi:amino-acid N-acetyltransferase
MSCPLVEEAPVVRHAVSRAGPIVRRAAARDEPAIVALVRSERLNPTGLGWQRFVVAVDGDAIVGAVQIRHHADGSDELGSLVVRPEWRGRGVAARMIDVILAQHGGRLLAITYEGLVPYFERWGFRRVAGAQAPGAVRRNRWMGQAACVLSLLRLRRPRRLVILDRRPG